MIGEESDKLTNQINDGILTHAAMLQNLGAKSTKKLPSFAQEEPEVVNQTVKTDESEKKIEDVETSNIDAGQ